MDETEPAGKAVLRTCPLMSPHSELLDNTFRKNILDLSRHPLTVSHTPRDSCFRWKKFLWILLKLSSNSLEMLSVPVPTPRTESESHCMRVCDLKLKLPGSSFDCEAASLSPGVATVGISARQVFFFFQILDAILLIICKQSACFCHLNIYIFKNRLFGDL